MKKIDNLIIIPCRKGSKGIKFKNFIDIKGKSLYETSLSHALSLKKKFKSTKIVISSDFNIKKDSTKKYIILKRPKKISGDKSKSKEYVKHALNFFNKKKFDFKNIIILQPTSPVREKNDMIKALNYFNKNKANSLISVYEEHYVNPLVMYKKIGKFGQPLKKGHNSGSGRKKKDVTYVRNGSMYIFKVNFFKKNKKIISSKPLMYIMSKLNSINIDTKEDLELYKKLEIS